MPKKIKSDSPMQHALIYLSSKARTIREMEDYLDSKKYGEFEVYNAVEQLKELGYLNDERYAQDFISSRLATKPLSRRKLKEQLYEHRVPADIIDDALAAITEQDERSNAKLVAKKFDRQFGALEKHERKQRLIKRLAGRGFDYPTIREACAALYDGDEDIEMFDGEADELEDE